MKKYFTSDWHLGEDRIGINGKPNLFYRPFGSIEEQNNTIINNFINSNFKDGDELWHLGDVLYNVNDNFWLNPLRARYPNSKFNLIIGNYDEDKLDVLGNYFDNITDEALIEIGNTYVYLNHYPTKCLNKDLGFSMGHFTNNDSVIKFAITGHIHGLWKVQPKMINVGVDAWHFKPVSEDEILFCWNAMQNFYDKNAFPY